MSKPLKEILISICTTEGLEYRERVGDMGAVSQKKGTPVIITNEGYFVEILEEGEVKISNFSQAAFPEESPEHIFDRAREWLIYSLIIKAL